MGRLEKILRQLRQEIAKITDDAPPGAGELDMSRLDDGELARVEQLLGRVGSDTPREEVRPRAAVLAGMDEPARATQQRAWEAGLGTPPPERRVIGALSSAELLELDGLLRRATVPEGWEGEEEDG